LIPSERVDNLAELMRSGAVEDPVLFQFSALVTGSAQYSDIQHAAMLALASSTYKGCLHRAWADWSLIELYEGRGVRVPHPKTTCAHLPTFQDPENGIKQVRYGLDPDQVWASINQLLRDQLRAAVEVLGIKDGDWVITIDTNVRPNYSPDGNRARRGIPPKGKLTPSAKNARKAFKQHNGSTVPLHEGTDLGDEFIVAFAHHVRTGGCFPVAVYDLAAFRDTPNADLRDLLTNLEGLPAPLVIVLDREFYSVEATRNLNVACARLRTTWVMPVKLSGKGIEEAGSKFRRNVRQTVEGSYAEAIRMPGADPGGKVYFEERSWPDDKRVKFTLAVFYWRKTWDYEASQLDVEATFDMDWKSGGFPPTHYATAFITNAQLTVEIANWLQSTYYRRWAAESALSLLEHYFGYSPSKELRLKFLVYGLNLVLYGLYGVWRHRASEEFGLEIDHPWLGLQPYLTLLRRQLDPARFQ
jgi:hypothetical protein